MTPLIRRIRRVRTVIDESWDCDNCCTPGTWCDYHEDRLGEGMDNLLVFMAEYNSVRYM
jgi:hypothetical protein